MTSTRCPSPRALERAYFAGDVAICAHAATCDRCGRAFAEIAGLQAAGREIQPAALSPGRREELRTAILSRESAKMADKPPVFRPVRFFALGAGAAALAALLFVWWLWPDGAGLPVEGRLRGGVLDHAGARYLVASDQPDEIVRLVEGTLTVEVAPLAPGEHFRVITADGEITAGDAAFDVTAASDHLVTVRVLRGAVEIGAAGGTVQVIEAGHTWTAPSPSPTPSAPDRPGAADASSADSVLASVTEAGATAAREGSAVSPPRSGQILDREAPLPLRRPDIPPVDAGSPPVAVVVASSPDAGPVAPARSQAQQAFDDGFSALRAGDFETAARAFERVVAIGAGTRLAEDASYWRAVALARASRASQAVQAFEAFLTAFPTSPRAGEASVMLGWLLYDRGDREGARRWFRQAASDPSARVQASAVEGLRAAE